MKKIIAIIVIIILGFLAFFIGKAYATSNNSDNKSSIENNNNLNNSSTDSTNNESTNSSQVDTTNNNNTNKNTSSNNKVNSSNTTNSTLTQTQINELSTKAMLYEFNTLGKKYIGKDQLPNDYSYGIENHFENGYCVNTSGVKIIIGDSKNINGKTYYKVKLMYIPYEKYGQDFATLDVFYIDLNGNIIPDNNANTILNSDPNSGVTATIETPLITPLMYQKLMTGAMKNQSMSTSKDFTFNQNQTDIYGEFTSIIILNGTAYYNMTLVDSAIQAAGGTGTVTANQFVYINGNNVPLNIQNQLSNIQNKAMGI